MIQPLNYTIRALEAFAAIDATATPAARVGFRYLASKLRQAQVFVLPDHGELLDRSKPHAEVPGVVYRPPFPVVALEYAAPWRPERETSGYSEARCSRRIALAWEWGDDLPRELRGYAPPIPSGGVAVASIAYFDRPRLWLPISAAGHLSFEDGCRRGESLPFVSAALASGRMTKAQASARKYPMSIIPILIEPLVALAAHSGPLGLLDNISADLMDEVGAYADLCCALACANVGAERQPAPQALNKARIRSGKLPFRDFHVLKLASGEGEGRGPIGAADRSAARAHLRRGHIRRLRHLGPDRITWVNASMVRGRGFLDKVYAA